MKLLLHLCIIARAKVLVNMGRAAFWSGRFRWRFPKHLLRRGVMSGLRSPPVIRHGVLESEKPEVVKDAISVTVIKLNFVLRCGSIFF